MMIIKYQCGKITVGLLKITVGLLKITVGLLKPHKLRKSHPAAARRKFLRDFLENLFKYSLNEP
jgi:hypothetical protein